MNGFTIPITFDRITFLAAILALLAILSFVSGIVRIIRERRLSIFRLSGGVFLLLVGFAVFAVAGWAQTYRSLTHNELVATIHASPVPGKLQTMSVVYTPVENGKSGRPQTFVITGDEWQLGGNIIKWQDWVNLLGVHTGYRTTRLMSYYVDANDYKSKPIKAYDLASIHDTVTTFLNDHGQYMPFIRSTYDNFVARQPDASATYEVYVSTSGYWTARK